MLRSQQYIPGDIHDPRPKNPFHGFQQIGSIFFFPLNTYFLKFLGRIGRFLIWPAQWYGVHKKLGWKQPNLPEIISSKEVELPLIRQYVGSLLLKSSGSSMKGLSKIVLRTYGKSLDYLF